MPTQEEYITAAVERVKETAHLAEDFLGPMTLLAIRVELKTMFNLGKAASCQKQPTQ